VQQRLYKEESGGAKTATFLLDGSCTPFPDTQWQATALQ